MKIRDRAAMKLLIDEYLHLNRGITNFFLGPPRQKLIIHDIQIAFIPFVFQLFTTLDCFSPLDICLRGWIDHILDCLQHCRIGRNITKPAQHLCKVTFVLKQLFI